MFSCRLYGLRKDTAQIETDEEIAKELQDRGEKFMTGKMKETGKTTNSGTEKSLP